MDTYNINTWNNQIEELGPLLLPSTVEGDFFEPTHFSHFAASDLADFSASAGRSGGGWSGNHRIEVCT
jgi:hypothetical protein